MTAQIDKWTRASNPLFSLAEIGRNGLKTASGLIPPEAAPTPAGGQLTAGAILTRACRLSFEIAEGMPNPLGNGVAVQTTSSPFGSRRHPFRPSKHQPTHNSRGQCSERNPIPVRFGGRAVLVARVGCHPSIRSPGLPVVVTFGVRTSEHESKEFPDDGNLTAQRIKLTAGGRNAQG